MERNFTSTSSNSPKARALKKFFNYENLERTLIRDTSDLSRPRRYYGHQDPEIETIYDVRKRHIINGTKYKKPNKEEYAENGRSRITIDGMRCCMCPRCYKVSTVEVSYDSYISTKHSIPSLFTYDDNNMLKISSGSILNFPDVYYQVYDCDGEFPNNSDNICHYTGQLINIDVMLGETISILNLKGYKTVSSCQGGSFIHDDCIISGILRMQEDRVRCQVDTSRSDEKVYEPYIRFGNKNIMKFIDDLPLSWYLDYDALRSGKTIIKSDVTNYGRFGDLYSFVCGLPNLNV